MFNFFVKYNMQKQTSLHTIVLSGLALLILGKFSFSFSVDFLYSFLAFLMTAMVYHAITNRRQIIADRSMAFTLSLKNMLIYAAILLLLIFPTGTISGLISLALLALFGLIVRRFVRYQGKPIFNPAVFALLGLALFTQFAPNTLALDIFTAWHGVNYRIPVLGFPVPWATVISFLLAVILTFRMRKYGYALGFFLSILLGGYFIIGLGAAQALLLDGTIYFFF